eukprot:scaffold177982_cov27-Tisochrysis_lutea.AAC.1
MAKKAGIEVWLSNADTPARAHTHTHSAASSCRKSAEMAGIEVWRSDAVLMRVLLDTAAASRKLNGKGLLAIYVSLLFVGTFCVELLSFITGSSEPELAHDLCVQQQAGACLHAPHVLLPGPRVAICCWGVVAKLKTSTLN